MKITKSQLRELIEEEINAVVREGETTTPPLNKLAFALSPEAVIKLMAQSLEGAPQNLLDKIGDLSPQEILHAMAVATELPLDQSAYGAGETSKASRVMAKAVKREFPLEEKGNK